MRRVATWIGRTLLAAVVVSVGVVLAYRFVPPPLTPLMVIRALDALAHDRSFDISATWVDLEDVNPTLLRAVIAAEDARFFTHRGIDAEAVARAVEHNARASSRRRGASTITMQCARNVFLWQGRTYVRKALEAYFATLLEVLWGKRRILEVYVNVVEWGEGVYGVEAAAQRYFRISASQLDERQAALLAAALPNPRRWNPAAPTARLGRRASVIEVRARAVRLEPLTDGRPWRLARRQRS
jgi:monofunctional glycosyltransferase